MFSRAFLRLYLESEQFFKKIIKKYFKIHVHHNYRH
jgi:hypothetical protein